MRQITYAEPVLFLYMFCIFLLRITQQQLIYKKVCLSRWNESYCYVLDQSKNITHEADQDYVQSTTAKWLVYFSIATTLPSLLPIVIFGSWSDKVGRKPLMCLPIIGDILACVGCALCSYFIATPVWYLLLVLIASSLFGGFGTILTATNAYVSDVTSIEDRTRRITVLECMSFLGNCLGDLTGGYMLQSFGFLVTFLFVLAVEVLGLLYTLLLKETYASEKSHPLRALLSWRYFVSAVSLYTRKRLGRFRLTLLVLLGVFSCNAFLFAGLYTITVIYMKHPPRNFNPSQIGLFTAEMSALKSIGAIGLIWFLTHYLKLHDFSVMLLGYISYAGLSLTMALRSSGRDLWLATLWSLGLGLDMPPTRSAMSKLVSAQEKGQMFSVAAAVQVVLSMISGIAFSKAYQETVRFSPSFTLYMMAGFTLIPLALVGVLKCFGEVVTYKEIVGADYGSLQSEVPEISIPPTLNSYESEDPRS